MCYLLNILHKEASSSCSSTAEYYPFVGMWCFELWLFLGNMDSQRCLWLFSTIWELSSSCSREIMICSVPKVAKFLKICFIVECSCECLGCLLYFHNSIVNNSISAAKNELSMFIYLIPGKANFQKDYALFPGFLENL